MNSKKNVEKNETSVSEKNNNSNWLRVFFPILLLPVAIIGNLSWEIIPNVLKVRTVIGDKLIASPTGVKSMLYFFDSFLRVVTSIFFSDFSKFFTIPILTQVKLFAIRFLGCLANILQCLGMVLCGGDMFAIMRQARIPLVAFLRFTWFNDYPTKEELNYLWIVILSATAFVLAKEFSEDNFGLGLFSLIVALFLRSFYYVLTELYLKRDLKELNLMEKQTLVGLHDMMGYFLVTWLEIYLERRSLNPMDGFFSNCGCTVSAIANFLQNWLCIVIMFWFDSMILQLLQTVATGLTWTAKCTYKPSEFLVIKIPILLIIVTTVTAYIIVKNKRDNLKKKNSKILILKN